MNQLNLDTQDIRDLLLATTMIYTSVESELSGSALDAHDTKVLRERIRKWKSLHDRIEEQLNDITIRDFKRG